MQFPILSLLLGVLSAPSPVKSFPLERSQDGSAFNGISMRILPLGASITYGLHSSDGNGYRLDLLEKLDPPARVTYIGSVKSGNMSNNENEGHPGYRIDQVADVASRSTPEHPNIILLHAGLNDIYQNYNLSKAPARLGSLVDQLHKACPDAVIVVGNLFTNTNETYLERIKTFDASIPRVISDRANAGAKVLEANMYGAVSKADLYKDGEHPNDIGYQKMASVWYNTLVTAAKSGWITKPVEP